MLPKKQRIPRKLFPLLKQGKIIKNSLFLLRVVNFDGASRFCFSISKKVAKSAVARNRARRMGYRVLRSSVPLIKPNILAIFSFLRIPKDEAEVSSNLQSILRASKLINKI